MTCADYPTRILAALVHNPVPQQQAGLCRRRTRRTSTKYLKDVDEVDDDHDSDPDARGLSSNSLDLRFVPVDGDDQLPPLLLQVAAFCLIEGGGDDGGMSSVTEAVGHFPAPRLQQLCLPFGLPGLRLVPSFCSAQMLITSIRRTGRPRESWRATQPSASASSP